MHKNRTISSVVLLILVLALGSSVVAASTLTIMQSESPRAMDPSNQSATYTGSVLSHMYDTLLTVNSDGNVVPSLATDYTYSPDGLEWTFKLRQGVTFHDGTPLNADAVKYSFERILNPDNGLTAFGRFNPVIKRVDTVDDLTVKFTLHSPYPAFALLLTINQAAITPPSAADIVSRHPVGTGPFKFVEYVSGERVVMERFDNFWGEAPRVDRLVWRWSPEESVMIMALQAGEVDVVVPLPASHVGALEMSPGVEVHEKAGSAVFWLALNTTAEPLNDVRVRQALNYATDRQGLVDAILWGRATVAHSPLAPQYFGYDPTVQGYSFDPEKARELLAEAGYPNGFTMSITVQESESQYAEVLQGNWRDVGVNVIVDQLENALWSAKVFSPLEENETMSSFASWSSILDADLMLTPLFATRSFPPASANLGFFSNARLDEILAQAVNEVNPNVREELYFEAQRIINDEAAHVTLYYANTIFGVRDNVEGVWSQPSGQINVRGASFK
ncbi:MAG TPA: glycosyl transferase [Firmicutes bacterium]|nr:glycosyl transferase [Bacillota bacterium]